MRLQWNQRWLQLSKKVLLSFWSRRCKTVHVQMRILGNVLCFPCFYDIPPSFSTVLYVLNSIQAAEYVCRSCHVTRHFTLHKCTIPIVHLVEHECQPFWNNKWQICTTQYLGVTLDKYCKTELHVKQENVPPAQCNVTAMDISFKLWVEFFKISEIQ